MEPLISIQLHKNRKTFSPGQSLECDYQIDAVGKDEIHAVEASVLWYSEGKGEEDMSVHFFERRVASDTQDRDLRSLSRLSTILPNSPLSYDGMIVKIHWCVRIRAFLRRGRQSSAQQPFQLGAPS